MYQEFADKSKTSFLLPQGEVTEHCYYLIFFYTAVLHISGIITW